jgi:hypothetical protein
LTARAAACVVLVLLAGCGQRELRLNDIQVLASHNSYKLAIDPPLLARIAADNPDAAPTLDYAHLPLTAQLERGLRAIELDVYYDPDGGRYASPLGTTAISDAGPYDPDGVMKGRGFKVLHVQDIDFRSSCLTLAACLAELRTWSDAHPRHLPIVVTVNAKDEQIDSPDFVPPLPFDGAAWDALDAELRAVLGDKLVTPDDVRGSDESLEHAVLTRGWPALDELRGRFLVALDDALPKMEAYAKDHASLEGRAMFTTFPPGRAESAVLIMNEPLEQRDAIAAAVKQGYLVRTRADADTVEARKNDTTRRDAAFASGAQIVSTDYYVSDLRLSAYRAELPGGGVARCNPIRVAQECRPPAED